MVVKLEANDGYIAYKVIPERYDSAAVNCDQSDEVSSVVRIREECWRNCK